jgi:hypothetical protein
MTQRTLDSRAPLASLLIACAALGCNDQRLRELGYTSNPVTASAGDDYEEPSCDRTFIDADALLDAVASDVTAAPAESRPFLRYLSLAGHADAGACPEELSRNRLGVVRLLNAVSRGPVTVAPRVTGPADSVIAIDLRDYGFTSPIVVEGTAYADGWEALIGESPFAVELAGEQATPVALATGTRVPVLGSDAFLLAASNGPLYYALLGVPATLGELRASLGLESELDPAASGALRTAVQFSRILRPAGNLRVLDRYTIANGIYWEATAIDAGLFLSDPLHAQPDAQRLIMYSLPNDIFAFAIYDAEGQRRESAELVIDSNRDDFIAHAFDSCSNCHWNGAIPGTEAARDIILSHADQFEPDVVAAYRAAPSDAERLELFSADSVPYQRAMSSIGFEAELGVADPFSARFLIAVADVDLDSAAADLLVTPEVLRARLDELPPEMQILGFDLNFARARFGELYRSAYCVLHAEDANPPAAAACATP